MTANKNIAANENIEQYDGPQPAVAHNLQWPTTCSGPQLSRQNKKSRHYKLYSRQNKINSRQNKIYSRQNKENELVSGCYLRDNEDANFCKSCGRGTFLNLKCSYLHFSQSPVPFVASHGKNTRYEM